MAAVLTLAACVTTEPQPDGSTKVRLSMGNPVISGRGVTSTAPGKPDSAAVVAGQGKATAASVPSIRATPMAGLFAKHPFDGTPKTYFPRAAVTVTDWSRSDCWVATATIWWNKGKSETVSPFSVCWGQSLGFAVNNAAHLHLFMEQMAFEHSGNVRTTGPKPPMLAIPDRQPISERQQLSFQGFIQQLVLDTGWQAGAPTNLWLVGYDASAANIRPATVGAGKSAAPPMNAKGKLQLEQALACTVFDRFDLGEAALKQAGWSDDQGTKPVTLAEPVRVYGFSVRKVAVSRTGGEDTYSSYLTGASLQQVAQAASLKLGKDRRSYGRLTKLGVLSADTAGGEIVLTCTVDAEGAYDD